MSPVSSKCMISYSIHPAQGLPRENLPEFPQMLGKCFEFLVISSDLFSQSVGHDPRP